MVTRAQNRNHAVLMRRLTHNDSLRAELVRLAEQRDRRLTWPSNMGERNYFTWEEVETYRIGNWFDVLGSQGGGENAQGQEQ